MEMIEQRLLSVARKSLRSFPVVGLTKPRQSGKTTLARFLGGTRP
jgi:predicted AAA+ superfamily ATPase